MSEYDYEDRAKGGSLYEEANQQRPTQEENDDDYKTYEELTKRFLDSMDNDEESDEDDEDEDEEEEVEEEDGSLEEDEEPIKDYNLYDDYERFQHSKRLTTQRLVLMIILASSLT